MDAFEKEDPEKQRNKKLKISQNMVSREINSKKKCTSLIKLCDAIYKNCPKINKN